MSKRTKGGGKAKGGSRKQQKKGGGQTKASTKGAPKLPKGATVTAKKSAPRKAKGTFQNLSKAQLQALGRKGAKAMHTKWDWKRDDKNPIPLAVLKKRVTRLQDIIKSRSK